MKFKVLMSIILIGSLLYLFSFWLSQNVFSFVFNISAQDFLVGKVRIWQAVFNPLAVVLNVVVLSLFGVFVVIGDRCREKGSRLTAGIYSALIMLCWSKMYKAKCQLGTNSIYKSIRHPQYLGFLLITLGMIVLWPVITTLIMWPFLFLLYRRLAAKEEKRMEEMFGEEYLRYKSEVPMFIPRLRK